MLCSESGLAHVRWREKQMNILVCDDNENAVNTITTMLQTRCQEKCISAKLYSYTQPECVNVLEIIDIAFLDIDMPGMNGITLAKNLRLVQPRAVIIFVTNFIQYAPEGYEVKAFRYLLKSDISIRLVEFFDLAVQEMLKCRKVVTIKINAESIDIPIHDILYLESEGRIIVMHLVHNGHATYRFYESMTNMEKRMEMLGFLRIQKSYLVNMEYIEIFQHNRIQLAGGIVLTLSEKNRAELKKKYLLWRGENKWSIC